MTMGKTLFQFDDIPFWATSEKTPIPPLVVKWKLTIMNTQTIDLVLQIRVDPEKVDRNFREKSV